MSYSTILLQNNLTLDGLNFLKGRILNECAKISTTSMGSQTANACERALIQALWDHTYRSTDFGSAGTMKISRITIDLSLNTNNKH
jgi:hypothetical protein